jgi:hypothetical protein
MMTRKAKKLLKFALLISGFVLLIGLVVVGLDFNKFRSYQNSKFFGSKDSYSQNQSLYFDDIKVTVTKVEHTNKWVIATSEQECNKLYPVKMVESSYASIFGGTNRHFDANDSGRVDCIKALVPWRTRKNLVVHYFIENLKNEPISIGEFSARIDGSDDIQNNTPNPKITNLLAHQSRYANFWVDVPMGANDFALVITKNGQQKQIRLNLPKITGSIIK